MVKKTLNYTVKIILPLFLGGAILYWMYREFDFKSIRHVLLHEMNWTWMLLSFPFGILAQTFRAWRWKQTLEPLGEHPRTSTCIHSIFISYASSLVVPRIGEFARCGVLKRYDGVSFPKRIGNGGHRAGHRLAAGDNHHRTDHPAGDVHLLALSSKRRAPRSTRYSSNSRLPAIS